MKKAKTTTITTTAETEAQIKREIDFLIKNKFDFSLFLSNYTTTITSTIFNKKYIAKNTGIKTFIAYNKIKSDIFKFSANELPKVNKNKCVYFSHAPNLNTRNIKKVFNIDLKSAYATILFNDGFISLETYNYICALDKSDRLAAVGMLARTSTEFIYKSGILEADPIRHKQDTEGVFYHAVNRTREIIEHIEKSILNFDFLFSWVDGIYFEDETKIKEIDDYLTFNNINYSIDNLIKFKIIDKKEYFYINFANGKGKEKIFNVPKAPPTLKKAILNYYNLYE